jgi:hypothetical protein
MFPNPDGDSGVTAPSATTPTTMVVS